MENLMLVKLIVNGFGVKELGSWREFFLNINWIN